MARLSFRTTHKFQDLHHPAGRGPSISGDCIFQRLDSARITAVTRTRRCYERAGAGRAGSTYESWELGRAVGAINMHHVLIAERAPQEIPLTGSVHEFTRQSC